MPCPQGLVCMPQIPAAHVLCPLGHISHSVLREVFCLVPSSPLRAFIPQTEFTFLTVREASPYGTHTPFRNVSGTESWLDLHFRVKLVFHISSYSSSRVLIFLVPDHQFGSEWPNVSSTSYLKDNIRGSNKCFIFCHLLIIKND